jgi:hypothetical protein
MNIDIPEKIPCIMHHHKPLMIFRVPMFHKEGIYAINIGNGERKVYNSTNAPPFIYLKTAMIKAQRVKRLKKDSDIKIDIDPTEIYLPTSEYRDMLYDGWRASESWYVLVLNEEEIYHMRKYT